ncbi:MAG: hypothetical protein AAF387_05195 [Pseudomonadota bacterium]
MLSPTGVFFSADIVFAITVFALVALLEPFVEKWLHGLLEDNQPFCASWDYFFAPLLRALSIVVFIYLAYPALFGLNTAPSISELLQLEKHNTGGLLGVMFLLGLLLPVIPALNRHPEFVLPIQGAVAAAYLFSWLAHYLHITTASVWPGFDTLGLMILCSYFGHRLASHVGRVFGETLDDKFATKGLDAVGRHIVELLVQIPVIITFGFGLGRQLSM